MPTADNSKVVGTFDYQIALMTENKPKSDIYVNLGKDATNTIFYLEAVTKGGLVSYRPIDVSVKTYKCIFIVDPLKASIKLEYEENKIIDIYAEFEKAINMST